MQVSEFDFELPDDRIALRPARPRDSARLLVVRGPEGRLEDRIVRDLPQLLRSGDRLVANDTRVICAALKGRRPPRSPEGAGAVIDVNLHRRESASDWSAFARPAKRLREGDEIVFGPGLSARVTRRGEAGEVALSFSVGGAELDEALARLGAPPLPPYIASRRAVDELDANDYQTVFAHRPGSVAAPTAGLHFTPALHEALSAARVDLSRLTLHVNAGTFLPVKAERTEDHVMHAEEAHLDEAVAGDIRATREAGGRCIAIGTTALRTLETASRGGSLEAFSGETSIFITPGFTFRTCEGLMTNFHLPRSTLFMLVSAFMGLDVMKRAYAHAIERGYRFYSYGDACLLLPHG
jgi:S-adenosylmethionine:tRNA ribosyltransferase-isomerase